MFTGLVEALATVADVQDEPPGKRITISLPQMAGEVALGASIAINGCCLTAVAMDPSSGAISFEAGAETLRRTNLGRLQPGSLVNVERSLKVGDELGGHFVTGHVDGLGTLVAREEEGNWSTCWFSAAPQLMQQMVSKGSIAVDGVSLTLVDVTADRFSIALIPHTLSVTTLGTLAVGDPVNLETDLLAKYVQKQLAGFRPL